MQLGRPNTLKIGEEPFTRLDIRKVLRLSRGVGTGSGKLSTDGIGNGGAVVIADGTASNSNSWTSLAIVEPTAIRVSPLAFSDRTHPDRLPAKLWESSTARRRKRMQHEQALRELLVRLLDWEDAHLNYRNILSEWPPELRGVRPSACPHTAWQLLEHLRICQWDILEFSRDPGHISPEFPSGYWPNDEAPPDDASWTASIAQLQDDMEQMKRLLIDPDVDLFTAIPHGQGQTVLREAVLVADHNSYHLGQLLLLRRLLGDWPRSQ